MQPDKPHILIVDNEDSFTWNLVQLIEEGSASVSVKHPSGINKDTLSDFDGMIISPGPGLPTEMPGLMHTVSLGVSVCPVLGVCLGLQAIAIHFGAELFRKNNVLHGRKQNISILNSLNGLFAGMNGSVSVGLYHSWAVDPLSLPNRLEVIAISPENIIMGIQHKTLPVYGVQFHPESYITDTGAIITGNWLNIVRKFKNGR